MGAYMARAPGIEAYFDGFAEAMKELGGRPHWGKEFRVTPSELASMYPRFEQFRAAVREMDPQKVFRSRFVDRLFADDADDADDG
jgi:xylitol oxidase